MINEGRDLQLRYNEGRDLQLGLHIIHSGGGDIFKLCSVMKEEIVN